MINQNQHERLKVHLNSVINNVFKILPLYEEKNEGLLVYVDSLLFELYGLQKAIHINHSHEYLTLLSILESIKLEISSIDNNKSIIKREVFRCINIIKNLTNKIEDGD